MEGNQDSSSCSEDNKMKTDEESDDVSGDICARDNTKGRVSKKGKSPRMKEEPSEDQDSSDEEVCSVCEVLIVNVIWNKFYNLDCHFFCLGICQ